MCIVTLLCSVFSVIEAGAAAKVAVTQNSEDVNSVVVANVAKAAREAFPYLQE